MSGRNLQFAKAVRGQVPLLVGIVGPSGTGKTFSALRLAKGIQRVTGGRIKVIDTEHRRALHYADLFDFDHVDFREPFGSLDYLEILKLAAATPGPVVVDSLSHEHDGPGGYLEYHEAEVKRLIQHGGFKSEYAAQVPAWARPSAARRQLIQGIIHMGINAVFCFRSKEKIDMNGVDANGKKTVTNLGWMPIAGDSFVYEMTMKCLLLPGADGVPSWHPKESGEKMVCKLPGQFREMFKKPTQLSEEIGEQLAAWAAGKAPAAAPPAESKVPSLKEYDEKFLSCRTKAEVRAVKASMKGLKFPASVSPAELKTIADLASRLESALPETLVQDAPREPGDEPPDESTTTPSVEPGGGQLFGAETDLSATKA